MLPISRPDTEVLKSNIFSLMAYIFRYWSSVKLQESTGNKLLRCIEYMIKKNPKNRSLNEMIASTLYLR